MTNFKRLNVLTSSIAHWEQRLSEMNNERIQLESDISSARQNLAHYKKEFYEHIKAIKGDDL